MVRSPSRKSGERELHPHLPALRITISWFREYTLVRAGRETTIRNETYTSYIYSEWFCRLKASNTSITVAKRNVTLDDLATAYLHNKTLYNVCTMITYDSLLRTRWFCIQKYFLKLHSPGIWYVDLFIYTN